MTTEFAFLFFYFFIYLFFFHCICLSICQSVCVFVHLFRINVKFLTTQNYWLAQLLYISLVSGLELKNWKLRLENTQAVKSTQLIKLNQSITSMDVYPHARKHLHASKKKFSKKKKQKRREKWEAKVLEFWSKQPLQQQSTLACFIEPVCMVDLWNDCFLPVQSSLYFSAWLWTTALEMYVEFFWIFVCG